MVSPATLGYITMSEEREGVYVDGFCRLGCNGTVKQRERERI